MPPRREPRPGFARCYLYDALAGLAVRPPAPGQGPVADLHGGGGAGPRHRGQRHRLLARARGVHPGPAVRRAGADRQRLVTRQPPRQHRGRFAPRLRGLSRGGRLVQRAGRLHGRRDREPERRRQPARAGDGVAGHPEHVPPARPTGAARPRLPARGGRAGRGPHRHPGLPRVAGPLRRRPRRARPRGAGQRRAVDDRRRHAGRHAVPAELRHVAAVAAHRRPRPPRQPDALDRRPARPRRRSPRGRRRGARPRGAAPPAVSRHQRARGRLRPDVQRLGEPRRRRADRPDVDGRGGVRPAHRLRQRRQPAARALGAAGARGGHQGRAGRHAVANRAAVAGREPPARRGGRRGRPGAGRDRHPPARRRDGRRRQAVLDDLPPRRRGRRVPRPGVRRDERAVRVRACPARLEDAGQASCCTREAAPGRRAGCARAGSRRRWSWSR